MLSSTAAVYRVVFCTCFLHHSGNVLYRIRGGVKKLNTPTFPYISLLSYFIIPHIVIYIRK